MRLVTVVGGDPCSQPEADFALGLGSRLGSMGVGVVTGGRGGVMEAVSQGCKSASGTTIGLLPGTDPRDSNGFVDIVIPTGMGELRNGLVVASGELTIAVGGEFGTLGEIALALKLGKTVLGWRTWSFSRQGLSSRSIIAVTSVDDACERVEAALKSGTMS